MMAFPEPPQGLGWTSTTAVVRHYSGYAAFWFLAGSGRRLCVVSMYVVKDGFNVHYQNFYAETFVRCLFQQLSSDKRVRTVTFIWPSCENITEYQWATELAIADFPFLWRSSHNLIFAARFYWSSTSLWEFGNTFETSSVPCLSSLIERML